MGLEACGFICCVIQIVFTVFLAGYMHWYINNPKIGQDLSFLTHVEQDWNEKPFVELKLITEQKGDFTCP